jgi:hypothetical protein
MAARASFNRSLAVVCWRAEVRVHHAELACQRVHPLDEGCRGTCRMFGQGHAGVIGRMHQHRRQRGAGVQLLPGAQPDPGAIDSGRGFADRDGRLVVPVPAQQDQRGEQLGERGRRSLRVGGAGPENLLVNGQDVGGGCLRISILCRKRTGAGYQQRRYDGQPPHRGRRMPP